jgi:hypothetical protein
MSTFLGPVGSYASHLCSGIHRTEGRFADSMVIQLAKRDGLKVIACGGSDEKVKFMREIGADVAFNYKTTDTREVLAREGPIDVYVPPFGAFLWVAYPCGRREGTGTMWAEICSMLLWSMRRSTGASWCAPVS